jgi:enolase 1/2/3
VSAAEIAGVRGLEILDSRGRPTLEAVVVLRSGVVGRASVPSGASTGRHEAVERRDRDPDRYRGLGVRTCAASIAGEVEPALVGRDAADQAGLDRLLIELDGTADKSRLGGNTTLAVSLAAARAAAAVEGMPLWRRFGGGALLPLPMVNMISGGAHASGGLDFQDFLALPTGAATFADALAVCVSVRDALAERLALAGLTTLKADEGGFGPPLESAAAAFGLLAEAVEAANFVAGRDVSFACDVAASQFFDEETGTYRLRGRAEALTAAELLAELDELVRRYPIVSLEDPLAEDDWDGWRRASELLAARVQLVGDDLFATNGERVGRGIELGVANAVLVKMNQAGTVTETLDVVEQARQAGYATVVSARSGETEDDALADLAVGTRAGQIKVGSVAQSERLAKYNRLLRIEDELGDAAEFAGTLCLAPLGPPS